MYPPAVCFETPIVFVSRPKKADDLGSRPKDTSINTPEFATVSYKLPPNAFSDPTLEVARVEIELHFVANPIACLDAVIEDMQVDAEMWGTATELKITAYPNIGGKNIGLPGYEADISRVCAALAAAMPKVRYINFNRGINEGRAIQRLYGQLAAVYANQLHGLSSDIPIIVPRGHRFTQLLGAHICYGDGNDYQHLRVDPASIMFLTLTGWPSSHSWAPFSAGDGTRAIEFPSLRTLSVTYTDGNAANGADMHRPDGRPWRLHFPALESLAVNCHLDVCPLLQYAVLPPRISKISISARAPVLQRTSASSPPTTRYLKISTNSGVNNNLAAMVAAGHILEGGRGSEETEINAEYPLSTVFGAGVRAVLTDLSVRSVATTRAMTWLIINLHSLTSLKIDHLSLADARPHLPLQKSVGPRRAGPLNVNIQRLAISVDRYWQKHPALVPTIVYVLLRLPALTKFSATGIAKESIMAEIGKYSEQYPHLSRIEYTFGR